MTADHPDGRSAVATAATENQALLDSRVAHKLITHIVAGHNSSADDPTYPLSGVGIGTDERQAKAAALQAAVLADTVLRSWFGEAVGEVTEGNTDKEQRLRFPVTTALIKGEAASIQVFSEGRVLWPQAVDGVMVVVFGAGGSEAAAEDAARAALTDKLAFLANERKLSRRPRFSSGRRYSQEMLMHSEGEQQVQDWLARFRPGKAGQVTLELNSLAAPEGIAAFRCTGEHALPVAYGKGFGPYDSLSAARGAKPLSFHPLLL